MIFDDHNRLHVFNFGLLHKSFVVFRAHIFPLSNLSNVSIWLAVVRRVFSASFYRGYLWQSCVGFRCVSVCCLPVSSNWQSNTWRFYGDVLPPFDHTWYSLIYIQTLQALFLDDSGRFQVRIAIHTLRPESNLSQGVSFLFFYRLCLQVYLLAADFYLVCRVIT